MAEHPDGSKEATSPARLTRRAFGVGAGIAVVGGALFASRWYNIAARAGAPDTLSTPDAHAAALAGTLLLIDIRRPDEWTLTGVGEGAVPLDMRRDDFAQALVGLTAGRTDTPVALICARGVRSRGVSAQLRANGFTNVMDVPEGMLGSGAGPGWLKRALPVVAWTGA
jgi:rhodanese-related sulfurtransferase